MRTVTEPAIGAVNGVNVQFETSATYVPGTVLAYLNGQLRRQESITELGNRTFLLDEPPVSDDILYVRYVSPV